MATEKTCVKVVRTILNNAKWVIAGVIVLNLFGFGYLSDMINGGLGVEETFWAVVMLVILVLLLVFDKAWKKICDKICDAL
ncbi:MAG: hypothetical protein PUE35_08260 [Bacteroidales bacterium]|nr:hypothetical protein [Bacteroidales bacterium]